MPSLTSPLQRLICRHSWSWNSVTEALSLSAGAAFSPLDLLTLSCLCNTSHDLGLQSVHGPTTHSNIVVCSLERRSSMPSLTSLLQSSLCRLAWSWSSAGAGPTQVSVFIVFFPLMFSSRVYVSYMAMHSSLGSQYIYLL